MKKTFLLSVLAGAALLCGCNKQAKINAQRIEALTQRVEQFQLSQAQQMTAIQTQLVSLAPMLDKMNDFYFEKSHDEAFFYHTNTLYLLLTVDKKIEAELRTADTERESENSLAYYYHTNQTETMYFCVGQIEDAMTAQEGRIENNVNAETRRVGTNLGDALLKEIKLTAPDEEEVAKQKAMEAEVDQIQRDLDAIKTRLGITNQPAAVP